MVLYLCSLLSLSAALSTLISIPVCVCVTLHMQRIKKKKNQEMESQGDEKGKMRLKGKELYKRGWKRTEEKKQRSGRGSSDVTATFK